MNLKTIFLLTIKIKLFNFLKSLTHVNNVWCHFRPSHGGNFCSGDSEEWQICFTEDCPEPYFDLRAQQCKQLPRLLNMDYIAQNSTWGPYESDFS